MDQKSISIVLVSLLILAMIIFGALEGGRIIGRQMCENFEQTHAPTRFEDESIFIWGCYTQQPDGSWKELEDKK